LEKRRDTWRKKKKKKKRDLRDRFCEEMKKWDWKQNFQSLYCKQEKESKRRKKQRRSFFGVREVYATVNDVITRIPFLVVCSFVQLYCGVYLDRMLFGPFVLFGTNPVLIRALLALYVRIFLGILTHTINVRF
jgi:hypothetical protein